MAVTAGCAGLRSSTEKLKVLDPPPGLGLVTTTAKTPVLATSVGVRAMVNSPASNGVMTVWPDPANATAEFGRKLRPRIERTSGLVPRGVADGVMLVTCGWGFDVVPEVTVKIAFEVPPPGVGLRISTLKAIFT